MHFMGPDPVSGADLAQLIQNSCTKKTSLADLLFSFKEDIFMSLLRALLKETSF